MNGANELIASESERDSIPVKRQPICDLTATTTVESRVAATSGERSTGILLPAVLHFQIINVLETLRRPDNILQYFSNIINKKYQTCLSVCKNASIIPLKSVI